MWLGRDAIEEADKNHAEQNAIRQMHILIKVKEKSKETNNFLMFFFLFQVGRRPMCGLPGGRGHSQPA